MKNIFFVVISLFCVVFHSLAQEDSPDPASQQGLSAGETEVVSCELPVGTEIVHFPIRSWERSLEAKKTFQEAVDTLKKGADEVRAFFEDLIGDDDSDGGEDEVDQAVSIVEEIAISQFLLTRFIKSNPGAYVFHEYVGEVQDKKFLEDLKEVRGNSVLGDITEPDQLPSSEDRNMHHLLQLVRHQFPNGMPEKYTDLNSNQKYTLVIVGGAHTLFFLEKIYFIFPSITQEDFQKVDENNFEFCGEGLNILRRCSTTSPLVKFFRAEKLSWLVRSLLNIAPHREGYESPSIIIAYNGEMDLSLYFKNHTFYRIPDHCLSLKTD